jgi:DNA-binding NtrC family response regulator
MKKILIIDDEPDVVLYLKTVLEDHNYETYVAYDADSGMKIALECMPDLILLDIVMPKKSGISFYKELKEHRYLRDIPVAVISGVGNIHGLKGSTFRNLIPDSHISAPQGFFEKPLDIETLIIFLNETLNRSKS